MVRGSSCRASRGGTPIGASRIVSPQAAEGNCTSLDGTEVSSGGAGAGDAGGTEAAGKVGLTGEGSSSWS